MRAYFPRVPLTCAKTLLAALRAENVADEVRYLLASDRTDALPFETLRKASQGKRWLLSAQLKEDVADQAHSASGDSDTYCARRSIRVRYRFTDLQAERVAWLPGA